MAFLTKDDFLSIIRGNVLDDVTSYDDTKINDAIKFAIDYAKGHINARYDTAAIFAATGTARSEVIKTLCLDIAIYKLHFLISPRKTPKYRKEAYADALIWFTDMKEGKINQPDLPVPDDGTKDYIKSGGNIRRSNHIE